MTDEQREAELATREIELDTAFDEIANLKASLESVKAYYVRRVGEKNQVLGDRYEEIKRLVAERDQLQARIDKALAPHAEFKIYDECGHKHTAEDVDAGRAINVADVGYTCADGYEYSICRHCCTGDSGFQSEECAGHRRPCWPCPTRAALQGDQPTNLVSFLAPVDWRDQLDGADPIHVFETWIVGDEPAWTQASPQAAPSVQASGEAQGDVAIHDPRPRKGGAVAEPNACGECGIPEDEHVIRSGSDGLHTWQEPSDTQRKARMLARREEGQP